uniref:Uncharacterized protein n=1 Tax=Periphykon beckeri TaxID=2006982 RepID=A0A1Z1M2Z1_9FLOR|nr:hypothetical protein [Periphykon beckeri]ARW60438.1 hypothetical protein [Periphykon beckeri]
MKYNNRLVFITINILIFVIYYKYMQYIYTQLYT